MPLWLLRRRSLSCAYRRKCRWCRLHSNRYHTGCNLYRQSQWDKWLKINNELVEVSPVGCFGLDLTLADPGDSSDVPRSNICHFLAVLATILPKNRFAPIYGKSCIRHCILPGGPCKILPSYMYVPWAYIFKCPVRVLENWGRNRMLHRFILCCVLVW